MPAHHIAADAALHRTTPAAPTGTTERSAMNDPNSGLGGTSGYEIRTQGRISDRWAEWFNGISLVREDDGTTVIRCPDLDQAAPHGLLAKVRDLGLPLISVTPTPISGNRTPRSST
jgi:hypothetical protein